MVCPVLWSVLAIVNLVGFLAVRHDKKVARARARMASASRVPERVLLIVAALGAGPAMVVAMRAYRHKTRKVRFLAVFTLALVVGLAAWAGWLFMFGCLDVFGVGV